MSRTLSGSLTVRALAALTLLVCFNPVGLAEPGALPVHEVEDPGRPLPAYMTPEEALLPPLPLATQFRAPPTGYIECPAEYEPAAGLFMAWEGYTDVLTAMAVGITVNDPNATVWVVVDTASEQTTAYNALNSAGATMSRVQFLIRATDTVWIRDYGPRFIYQNGNRAIIDHTYNRPRPNDNAFPDFVATTWSMPQYDIPLTHGGGNFHLFANGDAFMSDLILAENPGLTAGQVISLYEQYQGVNLTIYPGFPTSFDSTRHIDMWMMPVGDYKVIIGQYAPSAGTPYTITENAVTDLTSRGYTVYRTPGWQSGGTHYTYTNAVIINNQIFISKFGGSYTTQDAQALAVYQSALPGYTIHQVNNASIITAAGAMHCIVMHVPVDTPDPIPHVELLTPNGGQTWYAGQSHAITWEATDDQGITAVDLYYSTDGGATYPHVIATGETDDGTYTWTVPTIKSTQVRVKVVVHDADLNTAEDTSNANFTITPPMTRIVNFPLDTNPGWTMQGGWQFGPAAAGGSHGGDPAFAHTGVNVYGYLIGADYPNNLAAEYLTTTAINCRNNFDVELRFWRWLSIQNLDQATIEASHDGVNWTTIWNYSGVSLTAAAWAQYTYPLGTVADNKPTVYIRWSMGPTDASITYPGWSIDDVELWGVFVAPTDCLGDANCDHVVSWRDIDYFIAGLNDNQPGWSALFPPPGPACPFSQLDANADGHVTWRDIDPFIALLNTTCP